MSKSTKVVKQIIFEISQIDELFRVYADLLNRVQQRFPDTVEIAAVASVVHSFYNGLENIFLSIAKLIDQEIPSGSKSHRDLILQMTRTTKKRRSVISKETAEILAKYLSFRHFYRHSYSFVIDWEELKKLVIGWDVVWAKVKNELQLFVATQSED